MASKKDPFRPAERQTDCPKCGDTLGWNRENGLTGQSCVGCGYTFTGRERKPKTKTTAAQREMAVAQRALKTESQDFKAKMVSRGNVAIDVYNACQENSQSFEGEMGANLAYLMGAILKGERFEAWLGMHEEFLTFLREFLGTDHKAWESVDLMGDQDPLPTGLTAKIVEGCGIGNLDAEDYPSAQAWIDLFQSEDA